MNHHVGQQSLPCCELLLADGADQQLLPGVDPLVLLHVALPLELLVTTLV